jgi:NADH:ubiquinone oxidoreductase subunit D
MLQFLFSNSRLTVIIMFNRNQTYYALINQLADVKVVFHASKTYNLLVELFRIFGKT